MSKSTKIESPIKTKLLRFIREDGGYGFVELEISEDILNKHAKQVDACQPDIFAIFINNITKKCRDAFGI